MRKQDILYVILVAPAMIVSCNEIKKENIEGLTGAVSYGFSTPADAATQAKEDLLKVLEIKKDLNMGIDTNALRKARPAMFLRQVEIDFRKLLAADTVQSFADIAGNDRNTAVALVSDNKVAAVVEVSGKDGTWEAASLGNVQMMKSLNRLTGDPAFTGGTITVYEIPNIQVYVYVLNNKGRETCHLDHGPFSLEQPHRLEEIYGQLREEAKHFEKKFGRIIKTEQLVR